ncbi:MAG: DUF6443 domain-containing protein, partial [Flavobacteriaceae bacterium]
GSVSFTSGPTSVCKGSAPTDYNASATNASGYSWDISPSIAGTIDSNGTVSWSGNYSGDATITVTANGACSQSDSETRTVTITDQITFYKDKDRDGYADGEITACTNPNANLYVTADQLTGEGDDCNDDNADINPASLWMLDVDGDEHSPQGSQHHTGCTPPNNNTTDYALRTGNSDPYPLDDCDDDDDTVKGPKTWFKDVDGDGHPAAGSFVTQCDNPGLATGDEDDYSFGVYESTDCDDNDEHAHQVETWYLDADGDGHASTTLDSCGNPGTGYTRTVMPIDDCDDTIHDPSNDCSGGPNPATGENFAYTRTYQAPRSSATSFFTQDNALIQHITYYDDIGRPIQQIGLEQSPELNSEKKDIVSQIKYDGYGRMPKEWLPVPMATGTFGNQKTGVETAILGHYATNKYENTSNPYAEKDFDGSPLNRVAQQAAPGNDWALGSGHEIGFSYQANAANEVRRFDVDLTNGPSLVLNANGGNEFYGANELRKTITYDENHTSTGSVTGKNHSVEEFTDKQGRTILKRTYADIPSVDRNGDGDTVDPGEEAQSEVAHDTYYIYDNFGNLTYVLPPKMEGSTATLAELTANTNNLGYQYVYDHRNRLGEKKILEKGWENIVHNTLDQPIMTQDANMRAENNNDLTVDEWLFTKYDAFGRVAYTGKVQDDRGRSVIQGTSVDTFTGSWWVTKQDTDRNSEFTDDVTIYYDNGGYPNNTISEVLTINYYDNYDFDRAGTGTGNVAFGVASTDRVRGLATGAKIKELDPSVTSNGGSWITTVTFYDEKARPIYTYSRNDYLNTTDRVTSQLDFVGRPLKVRAAHTRGTTTIVTLDNFTYDHMGRLMTQTQCIGDETLVDTCPSTGSGETVVANLPLTGTINTVQVATNSITVSAEAELLPGTELYIDPNANNGNGAGGELIVGNTYDELGQLTSKKVGGAANGNGLQTVDFEYNVRGWLEGINDADPYNSTNLVVGSEDLWGYRIKYNDIADTSKKLYNGNISEVLWDSKTFNPDIPFNPASTKYTFAYDAMNRLLTATDNTGRYNVGNISYDKNGNIMTMQRQGLLSHTQTSDDFGAMDDMVYAYDNGNRLTNVDDKTVEGANFGFMDRAETSNEYGYDQNGNMTSDANKGITEITYNHLNLPTSITVANTDHNGTIGYIYDAAGTKIKKTVGSSVTLYAGKHVYNGPVDGEQLQFFSTPEGYVTPGTLEGQWGYIYQYKDHLGNVRLSYTDADGNGSIDPDNEIVEENNFYPFGMRHRGYNYGGDNSLGSDVAQKWKYNGVEFEDALNLELYEMSLRQFDPALARFTSLDPIVHYSLSLYQAFDNNPVFWADPSGANSELADEFERSLGADGLTNEQWIALSTPGGGGFRAMRSQAKNNQKYIDEIASKALQGFAHGIVMVNGEDLDLLNLSESEKEVFFQSSSAITVAILLYEFATGTGKETRDFSYNKHPFSNAVMTEDYLVEVITRFIAAGEKKGVTLKELAESGEELVFGMPF